jgi:hypothetical protein
MSSFLARLKTFLTSPLFSNIRAMLYVAVPVAITTLANNGKLTDNHAALITGVVIAFLAPAIASIYAPDGLKTWAYRLVAPLQAVLVGWGGLDNNVWLTLIGAVLTSVISSGFAAANVHPRADAAPANTAPQDA